VFTSVLFLFRSICSFQVLCVEPNSALPVKQKEAASHSLSALSEARCGCAAKTGWGACTRAHEHTCGGAGTLTRTVVVPCHVRAAACDGVCLRGGGLVGAPLCDHTSVYSPPLSFPYAPSYCAPHPSPAHCLCLRVPSRKRFSLAQSSPSDSCRSSDGVPRSCCRRFPPPTPAGNTQLPTTRWWEPRVLCVFAAS
jgi:hypothetical protein